jgi:hypothetical protein
MDHTIHCNVCGSPLMPYKGKLAGYQITDRKRGTIKFLCCTCATDRLSFHGNLVTRLEIAWNNRQEVAGPLLALPLNLA